MNWNRDLEVDLRELILTSGADWMERCSKFIDGCGFAPKLRREALRFVLNELDLPDVPMKNRWVYALGFLCVGRTPLPGDAELNDRIVATCADIWLSTDVAHFGEEIKSGMNSSVVDSREAIGFDLAVSLRSVPGVESAALLDRIRRDLYGSMVGQMIADLSKHR